MNDKDFALVLSALKAIINWNGQSVPFDKSFLELQDYYDLNIEFEGDNIIFSTKLKR